jgi:CubicO group peptidase (beta-lactamase class C family)
MTKNIKRPIIFFLLMIGLMYQCGRNESPMSLENSQKSKLQAIKTQMDKWVQKGNIVGAELLIIKSGEILFHEVSGWRDRERQIAMEKNTICRIRSMTKPIVGTAILMMAEDGKLAVSDKVSKYISAFDNEKCREITIEQLLYHTGGFEQPGYPGWATAYSNLQGIVDAVANAGPSYTPGERYSYSDGGSSTLAAIVTEVSGAAVEDFIQTRLFDPMKMNDSFCVLDDEDPRRPRISCTYRIDETSRTWVKYWDNHNPPQLTYFRGSGGVYSTTTDYAKFLNMWMHQGEWENQRYLQVSTVEQAFTPSRQSISAHYPYGYHWALFNDGVFGHGGSDGTLAIASPTNDLLVLYFTQSRGNSTSGILSALVFDAVLNYYDYKTISKTSLIVCGILFSLFIAYFVVKSAAYCFKSIKTKTNFKKNITIYSRLSKIWICATAALLLLTIIILLFFNDLIVLEKLLNFGLYKPGGDEIALSWIDLISVTFSAVFLIVSWIRRYWLLFERILITIVTFTMIYFIIDMCRLGLLTLYR